MRTLVLLKMLISRSPGGGLVSCCGEAWLGITIITFLTLTLLLLAPAPGSFTWHQVGTRRRLLSVPPQPFPLPHLPPSISIFSIFYISSNQLSKKVCASSIFDPLFQVLSITDPHALFSAWPCSLCVSLASSSSWQTPARRRPWQWWILLISLSLSCPDHCVVGSEQHRTDPHSLH